ncbi:MAG TPA: M36 family metallopeptidase [Thermoanaerobaculia bacterium]
MSKRMSWCLVALLVVSPTLLAAKKTIDLTSKGARIHRAEGNAPLSPPARGARADAVRGFLSQKGRGAAAQSLQVVSENDRGAVAHLRFEQRVAGLPVYGTYVKASVDERGRVRSVIENVVDPGPIAPAAISADDAILRAIGFHHPARALSPASSAFWFRTPTAARVAVPLSDGLVEGYLVETWESESNNLWHTVIDGEGSVVHAELRTASDTYKIFPNHPGVTPQTVVSGPGAGNLQSPAGWVTNNTTIGNNVDAYLDRDNNNAADTGGRPTSSTKDFQFTADLTQAPTLSVNQMAAVTNLFYLNNVIHDKLYRHGFNEAAGNFQTNNFGKGGAQNDAVLAEAQDGGGTNNANFATPADGSKPRMQMYLWNATTPNRDGDLDSDIVWHEYGHGLTWRMIGSMSGPLSGAIGEGMSDVLSLYINRNDVVGEYSTNKVNGIRRFPYTNYPNTYSDVAGSSVHADGEIYAATMWRLLGLWEAAGYTQDQLFDYVVDGMNYTPAAPAYEDMRDGILAAVPTTAQDCLVWNAFSQFGIGQGADGRVTCYFGIFCTKPVITESFTKPAVCP